MRAEPKEEKQDRDVQEAFELLGGGPGTEGQVSVEKFDWAALKFDFGTSGVAALERLSKSGKTPDIRKAATKALKQENRWEAQSEQQAVGRADAVARNVIVKPKSVPLPRDFLVALSQFSPCETKGSCVLFFVPGQADAVAVTKACQDCGVNVHRFTQAANGGWSRANDYASPPSNWAERNKAESEAIANGKVDVRDVRRRQVYVDGKPVGAPFE
jgi:hypothetical protein